MKTTIDQLYPDIWFQIFEYFNANELFFSLMHVTKAANEVLFNSSHRFHARGLVIDEHIRALPTQLLLSELISLELHQENYINIIEQCLELRSLKLVGQPEWVTSLVKNAAHCVAKLERLVIVVPGVGLLYDLFASIASLPSLSRLEIYADQLEERVKNGTSFPARTKIKQFILHSCSSVTWNDLSYMLPGLANIRFLDFTMPRHNDNSSYSFAFLELYCLSLTLIDVSFKQIIQLVMTTPSLTKLKLHGMAESEGFVINHKWHELFELLSSLATVIVNVSLERDTDCFYDPIFLMALNEINLSLKCTDDDSEYYFDERNYHRWWNLSGIIVKQRVNQ